MHACTRALRVCMAHCARGTGGLSDLQQMRELFALRCSHELDSMPIFKGPPACRVYIDVCPDVCPDMRVCGVGTAGMGDAFEVSFLPSSAGALTHAYAHGRPDSCPCTGIVDGLTSTFYVSIQDELSMSRCLQKPKCVRDIGPDLSSEERSQVI